MTPDAIDHRRRPLARDPVPESLVWVTGYGIRAGLSGIPGTHALLIIRLFNTATDVRALICKPQATASDTDTRPRFPTGDSVLKPLGYTERNVMI